GRDAAANALGNVEESQAEPEAEVGRANNVEIEGAETRDFGIIAEQTDPQTGLEGDDKADRSAQERDDTAARPSWCRPWRQARCRSQRRSAAGCIRDARP